jgi:hypothetical protein
VSERASGIRHLDFKRQLNNDDDLADDITALANASGCVMIIGVGTDNADRAASLHGHPLTSIANGTASRVTLVPPTEHLVFAVMVSVGPGSPFPALARWSLRFHKRLPQT